MDTLINDFDRSMSYDSQHYASNDSGLSSNSNGGTFENDTKFPSLLDFHCDDLTKSLFINSIGNNELIRDDDIYSYKNKLEIQNMFNNKFRSFNFLKSDNFKMKNSSSFSTIIQDLENLKESEPLCKHPSRIATANVTTLKDKNTSINSAMLRSTEDHGLFMKTDLFERSKVRKPMKKTRQQHNSNNIQEYVSSSVKNYKGNQSLNELVQFIQGTSSNTKPNHSKSKSEKNPVSISKTDITVAAIETVAAVVTPVPLSIMSDSGNSEQESPSTSTSKQSSITNSIIIDSGDSGTQSNFVSLNNSDEDSQKCGTNDFQEVLPKSRKKPKKAIPSDEHHLLDRPSVCQVQPKPLSSSISPVLSSSMSPVIPPVVKSSKSLKKCNKGKSTKKPENASTRSNIDLLDTKDSLQKFLSNQFSTFMKLSIMVSDVFGFVNGRLCHSCHL